MNKPLKKGEKEILESRLTTVENQYPEKDYEISITLPEFTCLCPITGYPDFATIHVKYIPNVYNLLESFKSIDIILLIDAFTHHLNLLVQI